MNQVPHNTTDESGDSKTTSIPLVAGYKSDREPVLEQVAVRSGNKPDELILEKSPAFVRDLAAGDRIRYPAETELGYELLERSGNLSIRVLRKDNIEELADALTPEMEMEQGRLDLQSPKLLAYTIHVSIGFDRIEALLDDMMTRFPDSVWYYGNVYDPADGVTPLNWWLELGKDV